MLALAAASSFHIADLIFNIDRHSVRFLCPCKHPGIVEDDIPATGRLYQVQGLHVFTSLVKVNLRRLPVELNSYPVGLVIMDVMPPEEQAVGPLLIELEEVFVVDQAPANKRHPVIRPHRGAQVIDRKSTRLNSSHVAISYAVFCLKH